MRRWRRRRRWLRIKVANGRLYIRGRHCHHGLTGLALAIIGVALAFHDRRDFPWPLTPEWLDR